MADIFRDRKPTKPNRFRVTMENGEYYYATLERADEPTDDGTAINATNLNSLVSRTGDTMSGELVFENEDSYYIYRKTRNISGSVYGVNAGCGMLGGKGVISFEVRGGPETTSPRLGRLEIGELGVSFVDASGKRTYLYDTGLAAATVG